MKYIKIIYNSFLWAMVIAITCFKNEWLQMRVNMGYILAASFILLVVVLTLVFRKRVCKMNTVFTVSNLIVCTVYGMIVYGFQRLQIVPAALIREGIHQTRIPFSTINIVLLLVVVVGVIFIGTIDILRSKKK